VARRPWAVFGSAYHICPRKAVSSIPFFIASISRSIMLGQLILPSLPHFLWVTEFPLFTHDKDKDFQAHGRWSSTHHPFTAPMLEDIPALYDGRFDQVRGQHYDLVLNGVEIGGGSVRIHDAEMQEFIFSQVLQVCDQRYNSTPCPNLEILSSRLLSYSSMKLKNDHLIISFRP
jgi:tRNA synthetases class II (D, K and N)